MVKTHKSNIASYILLGEEILIILYNYSSPESLIRIWWSEHTSPAYEYYYTLLCEKRQNPLKFKGKPFVIFVNMKIPENLNENTPPKDFPLKSKGKM